MEAAVSPRDERRSRRDHAADTRLKLVENVVDLRVAVDAARASGRTVALVPTMGALHDGHARLIEEARAADPDALLVVTIFVNPTQFGPNEDFGRYPRTIDHDLIVCGRANADLVFVPDVETVYPGGIDQPACVVEPPASLATVLEGAIRPGHFRGVATVVLKLINLAHPQVAYFGRKDYQQLVVIKRMVRDFHLNVLIRETATVREPDGLALSSRNRYLSDDQRSAAVVLWHALQAATAAVASGERDADRVRQILRAAIDSTPAAKLDYAEVADASTLEPIDHLLVERPAVALIAARLGATRLIDNVALDLPS